MTAFDKAWDVVKSEPLSELEGTLMDLEEAKRALKDGDKTHSWLPVHDKKEMRRIISQHEMAASDLREKGDSE